MWFDFAREERLPTQFPPMYYPVTVDVLEAGLIFCFLLLAICFYVILPGKRGKKLISLGTRITLSLFIGLVIVLGNFGQDWEEGHIKSKTAYKAGTGQEIVADIGVRIGLRSVNVTLKSDTKNTSLEKETINYNERFEWSWDQGRFGFGPYAGLLQREFREAQYRGLPYPILWIVDYFVFDGEGLRFGRFYRTAGWYCHILMWAALPCWVLANIFYVSVIRYGNYFLAITGGLQILTCIIWIIIKNPNPLRIPFEDDIIAPSLGVSFYLTLAGGILSLLLSIVVFILDWFFPDEVAEFFDVDPLSEYDEYHITPEELTLLRDSNTKNQSHDMPMSNMESGRATYDEFVPSKDVVLLKRRTSHFTKRSIRKNVYQPGENDIYDNFQSPNESEMSNIPMLPPKPGPKLPPKRMI